MVEIHYKSIPEVEMMKNQVEEPAIQQYSTNIFAYDCKYIQQSRIHKSTMAMNRHDTKYDMCGHHHVQYIIDKNLHDEDIQRIKISMKAKDIPWIKISLMVEDI